VYSPTSSVGFSSIGPSGAEIQRNRFLEASRLTPSRKVKQGPQKVEVRLTHLLIQVQLVESTVVQRNSCSKFPELISS
jgi:hypothetical protein